MKKFLISVAVLGIVLLVVFVTAPIVMWSGRINRPIYVTLKDVDGRIVRNATVTLVQSREDRMKPLLSPEEFSHHLKNTRHQFVSDEKGTGVLMGQFGAGGTSGLFGKTGNFVVNGDLVVTHEKFFEVAAPVANFTGDPRISIRESSLKFTVFLKRTETGEKPAGGDDKP